MSKGLAIFIILIITISGLSLLMVRPTSAQTVPSPTVPQFAVKYVQASYTSKDPYTGASEQVDNSTIQVSIQNQPLNSFYSSGTYSLYFNIRTKGHFEEDNWTIQNQNVTIFSDASGYFLVLGIKPSDSAYTTISYPTYYPSNSQVDFQVQAVVYILTENFYGNHPFGAPNPQTGTYYQQPEEFETTNWSNTQTVTISEITNSPTPTVPEFPWLTILPLLLAIPIVLVTARKRITKSLLLEKSSNITGIKMSKQTNPKKLDRLIEAGSNPARSIIRFS